MAGCPLGLATLEFVITGGRRRDVLPTAAAARGSMVSPECLIELVFILRQVSDPLLQAGMFLFQIFQPFRLIDLQPAVYIAPMVIALFSQPPLVDRLVR